MEQLSAEGNRSGAALRLGYLEVCEVFVVFRKVQ